ncbi:hypothetical protein J8273_8514 [Carpediemonas membranifera]|uniref:Rho-GAP domain-containing protein n=1 Tax=Carpediemonas membranifera TaxID=201153 RepID=A0A8J6ARV4_9EUKA|nr:hypothetical protein J8273_8514 [Carpediemonas membranifera]|eukprot:KAG9389835.1 hypothetical protein J8273_8514 [Carpediemonas membranifera]
MAKKTVHELPSEEISPCLIETVSYIKRRALDVEGIFRIPGPGSEVQKLYKQYQNGKRPDLEKIKDAATVCSLLKLYLRELPEPITTFELYDCFKAIYEINKDETMRVNTLHNIITEILPPRQSKEFSLILEMLHEVSNHSAANKMTAANLAIVFGPNLLRSPSQDPQTQFADLNMATGIVRFLIEHWPQVVGTQKPPLPSLPPTRRTKPLPEIPVEEPEDEAEDEEKKEEERQAVRARAKDLLLALYINKRTIDDYSALAEQLVYQNGDHSDIIAHEAMYAAIEEASIFVGKLDRKLKNIAKTAGLNPIFMSLRPAEEGYDAGSLEVEPNV